MAYPKDLIDSFLNEKVAEEYTQSGIFSWIECYLRAEFDCFAAWRDDLGGILVINAERTTYNRQAFEFLPPASDKVVYFNEHPYIDLLEIHKSHTCHGWYFLKCKIWEVSLERIKAQNDMILKKYPNSEHAKNK